MTGHRQWWYRTGLMASLLLAPAPDFSDPPAHPCRTGGAALAAVYILANPIFTYFLGGDLKTFVENNRAHFRAGGDAILCASALAQAFLGSAVSLYDPQDLRRQRELEAQLGSIGVSPGPAQPSASSQLYDMSLQLSRLARVLPAASAGDYRPFSTPTTELEQMQLTAAQVFMMMAQSPEMQEMVGPMRPMVQQLADVQYNLILEAAQQLAKASGG